MQTHNARFGVGEMAQWFRTLDAPPKGLRQVGHNFLQFQLQGIRHPLLASTDSCIHMAYTRKDMHGNKIMKIHLKSKQKANCKVFLTSSFYVLARGNGRFFLAHSLVTVIDHRGLDVLGALTQCGTVETSVKVTDRIEKNDTP